MFGFLKAKVASFFNYFSSKIAGFFASSRAVDDIYFNELEDVLIGADVGSAKSKEFVDQLRLEAQAGATSAQLKDSLQRLMRANLEKFPVAETAPKIVLVVGINGAGKTSFIGKYAKCLMGQGKRVLIVAADTFRAAAVDQLAEWATRSGAEFFDGQGRQDPAAVVFDGCKKFVKENFDHVIIDTAGRVQSKEHLMRELEKVHKVIAKAAPDHAAATWIVIDGTLGQNSLEQAMLFNDAAVLSGIVLTKLDSSARGGIVFAICDALKIPVVYMSHGESINDILLFSPDSYVRGIFDA
jgi:fused signal recognition particle receptor